MSGKKASKTSIAKRYAKALFELASEKGAMDKVEADLSALARTLQDSDQLVKILKNPALPKAAIYSIFSQILTNIKANKVTSDFCRLLGENRRLEILAEIIAAFKSMLSASRGEIAAEVISAKPLEATQKKNIEKQLKEMTGKKVEFKEVVDASIIGGLVIKIGSQMLDNSINGKLERLKVFQKEAALPTK